MIALEVGFTSLHKLLADLYTQMLPLVGHIAVVAKAIAGIGALLYVSYRVWQALARAQELDIFPLLRPFCIGICILFFPSLVVGGINTIMSPVVKGCHNLLQTEVFDMNAYQQKKDEAEKQMMQNAGVGFVADDEEYEKQLENLDWSAESYMQWQGMAAIRSAFSIKTLILKALRWVLEFIFDCAALVIDVLRTFFLIVLAILGPLSFAISIFDGFQATLTHWICRYVSVYLWLPIADIFSAILSKIQTITLDWEINNMSPYASGLGSGTYLLFLAVGIVGYFSIPTIADWVIQCGGMGGYLRNMNKQASVIGKKIMEKLTK
jgi:conjugative transposon TraJ protein